MSDALTTYIRTAKRVGCPPGQISNFVRAGVVLQERQLLASAAARLCDLPGGPTEIGYGGARGGGKSHWGLAQVGADDCQRYPGLKVLVLRKVGKALKEGVTDLLQRVLGGILYHWVASEQTVYFPNGSRMLLGHFQKESDIDAYLGLEYDVILIEEATTLSASKRRAILTCLRTSKPGWRPRCYSTTNPGGLGHAWYKEAIVDPHRVGTGYRPLSEQSGSTRYISATVDDNAFLNGEYRDELEKLTGWQLRAWRYGDWDIAAGQFFTNFRREIHVITPFAIPADWRQAMTVIARRTKETLDRHPWVLDVRDDPDFGPNGVRHFDQSLDAGFRPGIGNVVPDRFFWALPPPEEGDEQEAAPGEPSGRGSGGTPGKGGGGTPPTDLDEPKAKGATRRVH